MSLLAALWLALFQFASAPLAEHSPDAHLDMAAEMFPGEAAQWSGLGIAAPRDLTNEARRPSRALSQAQLPASPSAKDGRAAPTERVGSDAESYHISAERMRSQRMVVRRTSHVTVALGGRLPYFATAPPAHG